MTNSTYKPYDDLEKLAHDAEETISAEKRYLNFFISAELSADSILNNSLKDVTEKANKWRAKEKPTDLYINHGEFIGDGLNHIINELKNKPTSNRALYSLINQENISNRGDDPIPSFMIFQCAIDEDILYCTVYFRALEVANFFRINLEEIRLNICDISRKIDFSKVRLSILAFSAYKKPEQIPLEKCELDSLSSLQISDYYECNPNKISELLYIKAKETTVINISGLKSIKGWLAPERRDKRPQNLNIEIIISNIDEAIKTATELQILRHSHSHHKRIDQTSEKYVKTIEKIAKEFEACH